MIQPPNPSVTHGSLGLLTAYAVTLVPTIFGMVKGRAPQSKLLLCPVLAIMLTLLAAVAIAIIGAPLSAIGIGKGSTLSLLIAVALTAAIGYWGGRLVARRSTDPTTHRRGAVVVDDELGIKTASRQQQKPVRPAEGLDPATPITLAGIPISFEDETTHFKFIGTTGTGKSTAIREILDRALARGDRAVIADPDGGYLRNFYNADRGDVVLNPFEPDSVKWSLLGEVQKDYDANQLVRSLITDQPGSDRSWTEYARTFAVAVVQQAIAAGIQ